MQTDISIIYESDDLVTSLNTLASILNMFNEIKNEVKIVDLDITLPDECEFVSNNVRDMINGNMLDTMDHDELMQMLKLRLELEFGIKKD